VPSLDDVYRKFGVASEAAQLLETELGNILIFAGAVDQNLIDEPNEERGTTLFKKINRQTLGQLLKGLESSSESVDHFEGLLAKALKARNRLTHSFYRQHNIRRNSEDGRVKMLEDLELIHHDLLDAYKAVMRLSGVDLGKVPLNQLPTGHLPI